MQNSINMEFINAKKISEIWTSSDKTDFELLHSDENERKLVFIHGPVSFYVVCPDTNAQHEEDRKRWHVWSDNDDVLASLIDVQEFVDSCHRSITEILNKVNKALQPLLGHAAAASDEEDENIDDDFDEAYFEADEDSRSEEQFKHHSSSDDQEDECEYDTANANPNAVRRLLKDLKTMKKANGQFGVKGTPRVNNMFIWDVQLIDIPKDSPLGEDLETYSKKYGGEPVIELEMKFPDMYPMAPPFVRILKPKFKFLTDCAEYQLTGRNRSGIYKITLEHALSPLQIWCDMDTEKGGWTVIQRRQDGSVDFFKDWATYKKGFGNINGEYWLGNDNIYHLTNQKKYVLRVDMWDFDGNYYWAEYENFYIDSEAHKYTLHIGTYKGTAGDSAGLTYHNNSPFSTKDQDNDARPGLSAAVLHKGGFWYVNTAYVNLNGPFHASRHSGYDSITWFDIFHSWTALKRAEMKVRPMTFQRK